MPELDQIQVQTEGSPQAAESIFLQGERSVT